MTIERRAVPLFALALLAVRIVACSGQPAGSGGGSGSSGGGAASGVFGMAASGGTGASGVSTAGGTGASVVSTAGGTGASVVSTAGGSGVAASGMASAGVATGSAFGSGIGYSSTSCATPVQAQPGAPDPNAPGGPSLACKVATDCALPGSICIDGITQGVFTDPTCDNGQCHWLMLKYACGSGCMAGACCTTYMQTTGPSLYNLTSRAALAGASQPCKAPGDCVVPPPAQTSAMGRQVVACYSNPSCVTGSCVWEVDLAFADEKQSCKDFDASAGSQGVSDAATRSDASDASDAGDATGQ